MEHRLNAQMTTQTVYETGMSHKKRPFRVSIEGNVGCGKSTLINYFKNLPGIEAKPEPINEWRNVQGHNLLMLTYADPKRWNFTFQHYVQLSRLNLQTKKSEKAIQIFERSLQNNRFCFVEMAHNNGLLAEPDYIALCEWYDWIQSHMDISLDLIVYLRSTPEVVHERMQIRNRPEESRIPLDYLRKVHEYYEKWLVSRDPSTLPAPVLVIDVNKDLSTVKTMYKLIEQYIFGQKQLPSKGYVTSSNFTLDRTDIPLFNSETPNIPC